MIYLNNIARVGGLFPLFVTGSKEETLSIRYLRYLMVISKTRGSSKASAEVTEIQTYFAKVDFGGLHINET
jgi:hypothetical protein